MTFFKKFGKLFIVLTILLFIPASSYAIVDASIFGGRSFGTKMESGSTTNDVDGWQYGAYGHLNTGVPMVLTVGLGGFYLIAPMKDIDATKKTVGLDAYARIDLPVLPVNPYARYGIAIKETVEFDDGGSSSENFKSHYMGIGLSRTILSAIKFKLNLFAEYLYTTSKQENDAKIKGNVINVGITADI